jgi:hypothetical protein
VWQAAEVQEKLLPGVRGQGLKAGMNVVLDEAEEVADGG